MSTYTQQPPAAADQGTHHYLLTLQIPTPAGINVRSWSATYTPAPGATRYDAYLDIRTEYAHRYPESANAGLLAFDIQRNQL